MKNQRGFTLVEMLIVLLVISILLIITIPNIAKHQTTITDKGCEAFVKMVEAQVQAFYLEKGKYPNDVAELTEAGYLSQDQNACPEPVSIDNGVVIPPNDDDEE